MRSTNIHPGEILHIEFLEPLQITPYRLSKDIGVAQTRISEILSGQRSITADTAWRLSRYFGNSAQFWLNLQAEYDYVRRNWRIAKPTSGSSSHRQCEPMLM